MKLIGLLLGVIVPLIGQQTQKSDPNLIGLQLHASLKSTYVPKDFKRDIPYGSLVGGLSQLASRVNARTQQVAKLAVFRPPKSPQPKNLYGQIQWVVDDSQENVVGKSMLTVIVRTGVTLDDALDRFIDFTMVPAGFKPCSIPGPRLGDLCVVHEESGGIVAIVLRNNVAFQVRSAGTFRVPRYPGARITTGIPLRKDPDAKPRGWDLIREIDNIILEISGNAR